MGNNLMKSTYSKVRTAYKDTTLLNMYPALYRSAAKKPVTTGYVVFLEVREKELSDNFRLIRAALEHKNREKTASEAYTFDTVCIREGMENQASTMRRCMSAIPKLARAEFIFVSESSYLLSSLPLREETTVIQTWHACGAFKKFGWSVVGKGFGTTAEDLEKYPVHKNFSYVTVSSQEVIWAYAEAFHMEDRVQDILPIGVSRTDLYFHPRVRRNAALRLRRILEERDPELSEEPAPVQDPGGASDALRSIAAFSGRLSEGSGNFGGTDANARRDASGSSSANVRRDVSGSSEEGGLLGDRSLERVFQNKKLVLYAPTYRGSVREAVSPDKLDLARLKEELGDGYIILIKQHPFVKKKAKIPTEAAGFAIDVSDLRIEDLIMASDMLVTDYSSIVFEYSLFEKPMIFFAYDLEDYDKQRGFYYPVRDMMPGPICASTHDLAREIRRMDQGFDRVRVRSFKYRFMGGCDGHATSRILNLMDKVRRKAEGQGGS